MEKWPEGKLHNVEVIIKGKSIVKVKGIENPRTVVEFLRGFFHGVYDDMEDSEFIEQEVMADIETTFYNETQDELSFDYKEPFDHGIVIKFS